MKQQPLVEKVLSEEEQKRLTPDEVIQSLKDGNKRFCSGTLTMRDHSQQIVDALNGQFPKAVILSCIDSRVPIEDVFDKGIGDMFVTRVAGNIVNEDVLGSLEFSCKVAGAKLVLVIGHEYCGAIKGAIDKVELGNITTLLHKIQPAIDCCSHYEGDKTSKNAAFVDLVVRENIKISIQTIRKQSPILKEMEEKGEIKIVGGYYDLDNGEVTFYE